ncbi:hypothetical protein UFOVP1020_54 [uncultured Caudovirales phage]|uniref:Uncharacterized protein n=1 Tax=uncultured Caudovirales phage TaxID=2100421 RepID=A0A6J5Q3K8_9CAUD|nr:hypothetical protein UFOVP512_5 [uncultured Caudovirales phage]CAB4178713.1 hypothetical protein UFOVP1020_54 [uncultured Caudovirales phage]CAB4188098.1 hypothetical protein UFOVP1170_49 [uncultured Caudovirales phage]CAB4220582.1 hypothetical protein UFOVP1621_50 [uncultured Caudovirales phage]
MALNIGGGGAGKAYAKYNAKADKWFCRAGGDEDVEIERPTFVADFDNLATGWMRFVEGIAPEKVMDPSLSQPAPSPGENFKRGFMMMIYSPKYFGGAVEFGGTSLHLANAIKDVYGEYEAGRAANPGKLPVIACTGSQAMKDRYGTNYRPTLALAKWVDRPAELSSVSPVDAADIWQGNATPAVPARTPAQHVPPPAPVNATPPAPQPAANPLAEALF